MALFTHNIPETNQLVTLLKTVDGKDYYLSYNSLFNNTMGKYDLKFNGRKINNIKQIYEYLCNNNINSLNINNLLSDEYIDLLSCTKSNDKIICYKKKKYYQFIDAPFRNIFIDLYNQKTKINTKNLFKIDYEPLKINNSYYLCTTCWHRSFDIFYTYQGFIIDWNTFILNHCADIRTFKDDYLENLFIEIFYNKNIASYYYDTHKLLNISLQFGYSFNIRILSDNLLNYLKKNTSSRLYINPSKHNNGNSILKDYNFHNISILENLRELTITNTSMDRIYSNIYQLKNLQYINLSNNKIDYIDEGISQLSNLSQLTLNNNLIEFLPNDFGQLNLTLLYLEHNNLQNIPDSICEITELIYLYLNNNKIQDINTNINKLSKLVCLELEDNKIEYIPKEFCDFINGKSKLRIKILGNDIQYVDYDLKKLKNIKLKMTYKGQTTDQITKHRKHQTDTICESIKSAVND